MTTTKNTFVRTSLLAWVIVGTLDIAAAFVQTLAMGGDPLIVLRFIASGVFGETAFSGGNSFAVLGLVFHYGIAMLWTLFFFLVYRHLRSFLRNKILIGVFYGIFIWAIMNLVVLPLSCTPERNLGWTSSLISTSILILAIALPLTLMAGKLYNGKSK